MKWSACFKAYFTILALALCLIMPSAAAAAELPVGVVDIMYVINNHPDVAQANAALQTEQTQLRQEFTTKSAGLSDKDKQALDQQLGKQLAQKRQELFKPIADSIQVAMKAVADEKGLSLVIYKNSVALGGTDITAEVLQKLKK